MTATVMPPAERRLPFRAVAGLFMKWSPMTKLPAARAPTRMKIVLRVAWSTV